MVMVDGADKSVVPIHTITYKRVLPLDSPHWSNIRRGIISKIVSRCIRVPSHNGSTSCLVWNGSTAGNITKYGSAYYNGCMWSASRLLFMAYHNLQLESWQQVLHSCDCGLCCEISHLSQGTNEQNQREAVVRDRHTPSPGEKNGNSVLTDNKVKFIKAYLRAGWTQKATAKEFGVAHGTVHLIASGKTWKHIQ